MFPRLLRRLAKRLRFRSATAETNRRDIRPINRHASGGWSVFCFSGAGACRGPGGGSSRGKGAQGRQGASRGAQGRPGAPRGVEGPQGEPRSAEGRAIHLRQFRRRNRGDPGATRGASGAHRRENRGGQGCAPQDEPVCEPAMGRSEPRGPGRLRRRYPQIGPEVGWRRPANARISASSGRGGVPGRGAFTPDGRRAGRETARGRGTSRCGRTATVGRIGETTLSRADGHISAPALV